MGAPAKVGGQPPEAVARVEFLGPGGQNRVSNCLVKGVGVVFVVPEAGFRGPTGAANYIGRCTAIGIRILKIVVADIAARRLPKGPAWVYVRERLELSVSRIVPFHIDSDCPGLWQARSVVQTSSRVGDDNG